MTERKAKVVTYSIAVKVESPVAYVSDIMRLLERGFRMDKLPVKLTEIYEYKEPPKEPESK